MMQNKQFLYIFIAIFAFLSSSATSYAVEDFKLAFPVKCALNQNCYISSYFDNDRSIGSKADYRCGQVVENDNQNGIHISLSNFINSKLKVPVLAAADGRVVSIAEGLEDLVINRNKVNQFDGNACGNGIIIEHGGGWFTRYCHLQQDSVLVSVGDEVKKRQYIASIGSSGMTDWPRLDFSVSQNNYLFDPFSGKTTLESCGGSISPLWEEDLPYTPFQILNTGFVIGTPAPKAAELGTLQDYQHIPHFSSNLSFWALLFNIRDGDRLIMTLTDPDGHVIEEIDQVLPINASRQLVFLNAKNKSTFWTPGLYIGEVRIERYDGAERYELSRKNDVNLYTDENTINR